jgi:DNA-damage-inducible protein J
MMATNAVIEIHVDDAVKEEAAAVLAAIGLTISDAIRLMLMRVAHDHELPFDPFLPNAETIAAMEEARAGNLQTADTIEQFLEAMGANETDRAEGSSL